MSRLTEIKEIYDYILKEIMKDEQAWKDFLTFHARIYKHSFNNAVLIYAQRPEATLVADMEIWNRRIGRWINRRAKSIAVFDDQSAYLKLKYLFDIEDTHGQAHTIPKVWQLNEALESQLLVSFKANTLSEWIARRTHESVIAYASDIQQGLEKELSKTKLSGLPLEGVTKQFMQSLIDSVEYMTAIRSGIEEPKLSNINAFSTVTDFDTKALTLRLGYLTSTISEQILREIEREIKTIKKEKRSVNVNETSGTELPGSTRDLSSSDSNLEGGELRQEATREVRADGNELPERGTHQSAQLSSDRRDAASTDASSERGSMGENGETPRADVTERTITRPDQHLSELSPQGDDQNESRGDRSTGNHLQGEIEKDSELPERSSFFVELTDDELIEKVLLRGSGFQGGKQRIVDFFAEEHTAKEKADFLKNEYGTGGGSVTFSDYLSGFENHDSKGITIDLYETDKEIHLSWAKVASGIDTLIHNGKYFELRYKNDNPPTRRADYQPTLFDINYTENDIRHENYKKLMKIAPGILSGRYRYIKLRAPGFMDLVIEILYENRISLSHYYEQNGDLMSDPDMELIVNQKLKTLTAATFQQDNMAIYHEAYHGDELINPDLEDELNDFLKDWLSNIARQGHIVYKAYFSEDVDEANEEPTFDDKGHEIIIEAPSETDDLLDIEHEDLHEYPLEVGMEVNIEGRKFQIESIDYDSNAVSLMDLTFAGLTGYPIFRKESVDFVLDYLPDEKPPTEEEKWGIVSIGPVKDENPKQEQSIKTNYQFSPEDEIGIGGLKTKFRANIEAIKTLKVIEAENRMATEKEQSILARYVGWGGMPQAFDMGASGWSNEYGELKKLLSQEEYDSAKASTPNANAFRDDNDYPLLCSLEVEDEDHHVTKADMFTKQTIKPYESITDVDSAFEALTASLNEKGMVDIPFMAELYDEEPEIIIKELERDIYLNPEKYDENDALRGWETADEYLSGDVRQKLKFAKVFADMNPELFSKNVTALEKVQPIDLEASDIDVRLGTTWIEPTDYEQFIYETLKTPRYYHNTGGRNEIKVHYNNYNASFGVENKGLDGYSVSAKETYGTSRINAYYIIEDSLNLRNSTVKDRVEDGDTVKYVINKKETMLAREKQSLLKQAFKEWLFKDPERRKKYVDYYNQHYNNIRLREYDGSHLKFPGMNPDIKLREHQTAAIARIIYGGSTLLAHSVGAGKTFEMVASCMEQKRLGLINKAVLVVPNHLTQHIGSEFLRLYPSANILVTTKKDFQKSNRRRFVSRIATGAYDAVIMGHSQFEKIPVSKERQEEMIHRQINDISAAIADAKKSNGENWSIKQMEKLKLSLTAEIKRLHDSPKDDVINFEELGIDCVYVDEAHYFKNCAVFSKIRNVAGISNTRSKKSMDMLMKTQYIQEINQGRGVIFATGTPISYIQNQIIFKVSRKAFKTGQSHRSF